jgi:hypothetical protein
MNYLILLTLILITVAMAFNNKKIKISRFFQPRIKYFEYNNENKLYTIISPNNLESLKLLKDLRINEINHIHINSRIFTNADINGIYEHYMIDKKLVSFDDPIIFLDELYIGGIFEMNQIISKY